MNTYLEKIALGLIETGMVGGTTGALAADDGNRRKGALRGTLAGIAGGFAGSVAGGVAGHIIANRSRTGMALGDVAGTLAGGYLGGKTARTPKDPTETQDSKNSKR